MTQENKQVIQISSIKELQKIGNDPAYPLDGEYELTRDIDASDTINWKKGKGFKPIKSFTGKFYGKGYKIVNLYINRSDRDDVGLFGRLYGEIRDLGIENAMVTGSNQVGGLVGANYGGTLSNCYSTGTINGDNHVGGLVGSNQGTMTICYSMGSVSGKDRVGGLVGYNKGTLNDCYSTGSVIGNNKESGGLIGRNEGTVSGCYSTGPVIENNNVDGLAEVNCKNTITNSCSTSSTNGNICTAGRLIGYNYRGMITNSYSKNKESEDQSTTKFVNCNVKSTINSHSTNSEKKCIRIPIPAIDASGCSAILFLLIFPVIGIIWSILTLFQDIATKIQ